MKAPVPFGKYYLLERINIGGMAEVFKAKAFGVEGFERFVAVNKILPSIAEDIEFINMFIDEAKICVQLNHANIAQIFDLGKVGDAYFIAMEYVSGRDARAIFNRARKLEQIIPIEVGCYCTLRICEGLDYAHNKKDSFGRDLNIIHRDVSPQNIMMSYEGEVKIIDFGIAKAANKASRTQAGILKGKFGYMSPEQVRGLPFDKRSDIFSLGTVLYELLTCERLFLGETDFSTLEKVRNVEIKLPREINPLISEELERIVMKSLARNPDDRYQNAMELHTELQHYLFTTGSLCTRKELTEYMKTTFAAEIDRERQKYEIYRNLLKNKRPTATPPPPPPQAMMQAGTDKPKSPDILMRSRAAQNSQIIKSSQLKAGPGLSWDEDEIETHVFDKDNPQVASPPARAPETESSLKKIVPTRPQTRSRPTPQQRPRVMPVPAAAVANPTRSKQFFTLLLVTFVALVGGLAYIFVHLFSEKNARRQTPALANPSVSVQVRPFQTSELTKDPSFKITIKLDNKRVFSGSTVSNPFIMDVSEGRHTITISKRLYRTSRTIFDGKKGIRAAMTIPLERIPALPELTKGRLFFQGLPRDATVYVDGKLTQASMTAPIELSAGKHTVKVVSSSPLFKAFVQNISVKAGAILPPLYVKFVPKTTTLAFVITPKGATVWVRDLRGKKVYLGPVPKKPIALTPTEQYNIEIAKKGFVSVAKTIKASQPKIIETITLLAAPPKDLKRDPRRTPKKDPRKIPTRDPKKTPKKDPRKTPTKDPRKTPTKDPVNVVKAPQFGTLSINARPAARVIINGVNSGTTPVLGRRLKAGTYTVTLIALSTGKKKTIRVTIPPNGTARRFVPIGTP